jgi:hypothetical protein
MEAVPIEIALDRPRIREIPFTGGIDRSGQSFAKAQLEEPGGSV